jgi:hypothetical protein
METRLHPLGCRSKAETFKVEAEAEISEAEETATSEEES